MTDAPQIIIPEMNFRVALRRPGRETVRVKLLNWAAINEWLTKTAGKRNYPYGTVATITDWKGITNKFLVTGGKDAPPKITQLASQRVRLAFSSSAAKN